MGDEVWSYTQDIPGASLTSGFRRNPFVGKYGQQMTSDLVPRHMEAAIRGKLWVATALPAGNAIPINTTTAPTFFLWNPADSGVYVVPIAFRYGFASGTGIAGGIGYNQLLGAGGAQGTATTPVVTAITDITPKTALVGGSGSSRARFATTATIVTATSSFLLSSGLSQGAPLTSTAAVFSMVDTLEGAIVLSPGTAIYPVANTAIAEVSQTTCLYVELPV